MNTDENRGVTVCLQGKQYREPSNKWEDNALMHHPLSMMVASSTTFEAIDLRSL